MDKFKYLGLGFADYLGKNSLDVLLVKGKKGRLLKDKWHSDLFPVTEED